jgi:hypothetical protein
MKRATAYSAFFAISLVLFSATSSIAQDDALPTLRGEAAINALKQRGQHDGLLQAARTEDAQMNAESTESLFGQSAKIFAADGGSFDNFGFSVASVRTESIGRGVRFCQKRRDMDSPAEIDGIGCGIVRRVRLQCGDRW